MSSAELAGATALVTGASSGIGAELARVLARRDVARLVLVARRRDRLEALAAELGERARVRVADLADADQVRALITAEPQVDVLVNNAGFGWGEPFARQALRDPDRLLRMIDLNCRAVVQLTAAWLPGMLERNRGWILNVGSVAGLTPVPDMSVYGATKAFVTSHTESLRVELRGTGIRVHLLAPGPVLTEFFDVAHPGQKRPPSFLFMSPSRVAEQAVCDLLADRPRRIPGLPIRLGAAFASALPMPLWRLLARLSFDAVRRKLDERS